MHEKLQTCTKISKKNINAYKYFKVPKISKNSFLAFLKIIKNEQYKDKTKKNKLKNEKTLKNPFKNKNGNNTAESPGEVSQRVFLSGDPPFFSLQNPKKNFYLRSIFLKYFSQCYKKINLNFLLLRFSSNLLLLFTFFYFFNITSLIFILFI